MFAYVFLLHLKGSPVYKFAPKTVLMDSLIFIHNNLHMDFSKSRSHMDQYMSTQWIILDYEWCTLNLTPGDKKYMFLFFFSYL